MNNSFTNTSDLKRLMAKLDVPLTKICFKDQIGRLRVGNYIINMASSGGGGTHWVALHCCMDEGRRETFYFDSFGAPPPLEVSRAVRVWAGHRLSYSRRQIQNIRGGHCGQYCCLFLWFMQNDPNVSASIRRPPFLRLWSREPEKNLRRLQEWLVRLQGLRP